MPSRESSKSFTWREFAVALTLLALVALELLVTSVLCGGSL